jgi:hypothetical protein
LRQRKLALVIESDLNRLALRIDLQNLRAAATPLENVAAAARRLPWPGCSRPASCASDPACWASWFRWFDGFHWVWRYGGSSAPPVRNHRTLRQVESAAD